MRLLRHLTLWYFLVRLERHHDPAVESLTAWYLKPFRTETPLCCGETDPSNHVSLWKESEQECSVGLLEERRRGWREVKLICLSCTTQPSGINVFL